MITKNLAIMKLNPSIITIVGDVAYDDAGKEVAYDLDAVNAYMESQAYIAKRIAEYPPIQEQLDAIFHDGLDAWKAQIQAIKDKYPK
jgi:hypothetical protein